MVFGALLSAKNLAILWVLGMLDYLPDFALLILSQTEAIALKHTAKLA